MAEPGINQSVERSAAMLRTFASNGSAGAELRVADVARAVGIGVSTASRMLATLETVGFVERDPSTQLYRLGRELINLGGRAVNADPVHRAARQPAQELAARTGLGVNVAVRDHDQLFYLCNFEGTAAPRSFVLTGQRNSLTATGLGKCLLLALSADERRQLLPATLPSFTQNTIDRRAQLETELAEVSRRGYATEREELALGRACIAAPIRSVGGTVVAGLSISGPLTVLDLDRRERELAVTVIEAADAISVQLGYDSHQVSA